MASPAAVARAQAEAASQTLAALAELKTMVAGLTETMNRIDNRLAGVEGLTTILAVEAVDEKQAPPAASTARKKSPDAPR